MVKREEPTIKKAEDVLEYLGSLDEIRRYYEAREMAIHDEVTRTIGAREEGLREGMERGMERGIKEGIREGRMKEKLKVAINLPGRRPRARRGWSRMRRLRPRRYRRPDARARGSARCVV